MMVIKIKMTMMMMMMIAAIIMNPRPALEGEIHCLGGRDGGDQTSGGETAPLSL